METHLHILTVIDNCSLSFLFHFIIDIISLLLLSKKCLVLIAIRRKQHQHQHTQKKKYRQLLFLRASLMVVFICFYGNHVKLTLVYMHESKISHTTVTLAVIDIMPIQRRECKFLCTQKKRKFTTRPRDVSHQVEKAIFITLPLWLLY